jgi:hypothetical protein
MSNGTSRRERLHRMIDVALARRGGTKSELAAELDRHRSRLYSESDNPRLDALISLSETIGWPIQIVVQCLLDEPKDAPLGPDEDYASLEEAAKAAGRAANYTRVAELGRRMFLAAQTPDEKARACRREGSGWGEQVHATKALAAYERGLELTGVSKAERLALQVSLANTYYNLWKLPQAIGLAYVVLDALTGDPPATSFDRITEAFAHYVRGNSLRRMLVQCTPDARDIATRAKHDLERAETLYTALARDSGTEYLAAIAHACQGGLVEVNVELGLRSGPDALLEVLGELSKLDGEATWPDGHWLESYGWWCDFGANIAFRSLLGAELQRTIAILSGKLFDIGRRLDDCALLDRVTSIEYALHERLSETTGVTMPRTLDADDLWLISGTIGRVPQFRQLGWDLIEQAVIVPNAKRT